eukprot:TRINITY_DN6839_c0_g1_i1.p1 TRINITY_DN6839_c0_g1~~TRINITY_DN6839_c0_g1_i1.p1  ORF type:complete len:103 (-),score=1.40 TRINITY_DN6839_c0_g1_i1:322-630(-)
MAKQSVFGEVSRDEICFVCRRRCLVLEIVPSLEEEVCPSHHTHLDGKEPLVDVILAANEVHGDENASEDIVPSEAGQAEPRREVEKVPWPAEPLSHFGPHPR